MPDTQHKTFLLTCSQTHTHTYRCAYKAVVGNPMRKRKQNPYSKYDLCIFIENVYLGIHPSNLVSIIIIIGSHVFSNSEGILATHILSIYPCLHWNSVCALHAEWNGFLCNFFSLTPVRFLIAASIYFTTISCTPISRVSIICTCNSALSYPCALCKWEWLENSPFIDGASLFWISIPRRMWKRLRNMHI